MSPACQRRRRREMKSRRYYAISFPTPRGSVQTNFRNAYNHSFLHCFRHACVAGYTVTYAIIGSIYFTSDQYTFPFTSIDHK